MNKSELTRKIVAIDLQIRRAFYQRENQDEILVEASTVKRFARLAKKEGPNKRGL